MNVLRTLCIGLLLACLSLHLPGEACAQQKKAEAPAGGKVTLDFKEIELADLIQTVSEMTGRNFIFDDTVKGKVTIISPTQMSMTEAYNLFLTVLNVKGFTVVPAGRANKIVPTRDAKENSLPTTLEGGSGEQFVTHLIPLQNVDATLLATTVLTPLIPKTSNIVAYAPANTLIITDSAANIERLIKIIQELDVASAFEALEVIPLEYAAAEEVAQICNQVISQVTASPRRGRAAQAVQAAGTAGSAGSKVLPYPRTNALVVMATTDDLTTIKGLVQQLDQKPSRERSHINVYYLENADAETLAKTLNEILTGIKAQARQARPAAAGQAAAPLASEPVTITSDKPTNALIINSNPEDYEVIQQIVRQLDVKRKQVFVEALILELSMDATQKLGASLQGAVGVGDDSLVFGSSNLNTGPTTLPAILPAPGTTTPTLLNQSIQGILLGGLFNPITTVIDGQEVTVPALSALIDVSKVDTDVNILSAPRLLTSDNEEAEIIVGSNVPIITSRLTDTTNPSAQSVSIERKDVALILRFTPQITEGNLVRLNVMQEITDLAPATLQAGVGNVNQVGPALTKRLVRNTVVAENGRTIVLGGLIGNNVQEIVSKTPLLGDIPLLGWLFKRKSTTARKTNLLLFITPHIIRSAEDLAGVTRRSRDAMDRFRDEGITPGWSIDLPPAPAPAEPQVEPAEPQVETPAEPQIETPVETPAATGN